MTREEACVAGYNIVQNSGVAKTKLFHALEAASHGNYDEARCLIESAEELICKAQSLKTRPRASKACSKKKSAIQIQSWHSWSSTARIIS